MVLSKEDKGLLLAACQTEQNRMARAINAAANQSIKEILHLTTSLEIRA